MKERTFFDTEQQVHKDKVMAAASAYLAGRSGSKRKPLSTKRSRNGFKALKKSLEK